MIECKPNCTDRHKELNTFSILSQNDCSFLDIDLRKSPNIGWVWETFSYIMWAQDWCIRIKRRHSEFDLNGPWANLAISFFWNKIVKVWEKALGILGWYQIRARGLPKPGLGLQCAHALVAVKSTRASPKLGKPRPAQRQYVSVVSTPDHKGERRKKNLGPRRGAPRQKKKGKIA